MNITVRNARREDRDAVNRLREMVNALHVAGRPDIFRPGFCKDLQDQVDHFFKAEDYDVIVACVGDEVCGFSIVEYVHRPETAYGCARCFAHIQEFGVSPSFRRQSAATKMIEFCRQQACQRGFDRIELDVWAFNEEAEKFYEAMGFRCYRKYMAMEVQGGMKSFPGT